MCLIWGLSSDLEALGQKRGLDSVLAVIWARNRYFDVNSGREMALKWCFQPLFGLFYLTEPLYPI